MSWDDLLNNAYTPYSGNPRACIVEGRSGTCYQGVRIENISFPLTISAVQAACSICLSYGDVPKVIYLSDNIKSQDRFWIHEFDCEVIEMKYPSNCSFVGYVIPSSFEKGSELKNLLSKAVTPNSNFPVSALLFSEEGVITGVNIEVSVWSMGLCAERIALSKAIAMGVKSFKNIAVHTLKGEFSSPCGACRQVLFEHLPLSKAELHHADGTYSEHFFQDLLPFSFTSIDLRK